MFRIAAVAAAGAAIAVWVLVLFLVGHSVQKAVNQDAVAKAVHWGTYMSSRIPDLRRLIETGDPTQSQKEAIRELRQLGDVFRFKLFDAQGRLVLISDEDFISDPNGIASEFDPEPLQVAQTGETIVAVFDGTQKKDRPDLYAEAYIALLDDAGAAYGVAEVYVDETMAQAYFTESFEEFGLIVSLLTSALFLVPAIAYGVQRNLAERSRSEATYLAKYDTLTGLLNRAEFTRRAQALIETGQLAALLFLDADKFKQINDTYGHAVGDKCLEQIGRTLAASTGPDDLVGRFGGDEFVVAMTSANQDVVLRRVRSILAHCAKPLNAGERTLVCSVSVGVSISERHADLDSALAEADAALYYAKSAGRNQFALYGDGMGAEIRRRITLEQRVREAAEADEFTIEYQPLVDGTDHRTIGYEALLRLRGKDGAAIPPSDFIPIAEATGLINKIGAWVIRQAITEIARLPGSPKIAINLSVAQFASGELPAIVADALSSSGFPAERLELEITESLLLADDPKIALQIDSLQELGVRIAMDDFGTGFSSLGYLWKYGFDRIKIDRSFVSGLDSQSARAREIIETVILLGKRLNMQVTAEGVESQEQSDVLSGLGCDTLQGYYFGKPAKMTDLQGDDPAAVA